MKKLTGILLVLAMVLSMCVFAQAEAQDKLAEIKKAGKLVVATSPDYPPYEFLNKDGKATGADIKMAEFIAKKLGVELVVEAMDFDTCLASVSAGKVDMVLAGLVPKEARKATMDFSKVYYNDGNQVIVILKENADKLKKLEDFKDKTVAAQNGTLQVDLVKNQLPEAKLEQIVKVPDAIMMLMTKKVDGIAMASVPADQYIKNYPDLVKCETPFEYASLGVAVAMPKGQANLVKAVDEAIDEALAEKLYDTWMQEAADEAAVLAQ